MTKRTDAQRALGWFRASDPWWKGLATRLRANRDYMVFTYGRFWPLAASAALFGLAIIVEFPVLPSHLVIPIVSVGLVGSLVLLYRDIHSTRRELREYDSSATARIHPVPEDLPPGSRFVSVGSPVAQSGMEHFIITDDDINARLSDTRIGIDVSDADFDLPDSLEAIGRRSLRLARRIEKREGRTKRATRFNGRLARLASDLSFPVGMEPTVCLQRVRFFDGESSNELWSRDFTYRGSVIENPAQGYLLGNVGELLPIGATRLANIVGITMVTVTADGMIVFVRQSSRNSIAPDSVSASASGSLEWRDVTDRGLSFQEVLLKGMYRELKEESGVEDGEVVSAHLTSYYRWWNRGAKPEFTAVARASCTWAELKRRRLTAGEKEFTAARFAAPLSSLVRALDSAPAQPMACSLPRDALAAAWSDAFPEDPHTGKTLPVSPSCEAAWRAAVQHLVAWANDEGSVT